MRIIALMVAVLIAGWSVASGANGREVTSSVDVKYWVDGRPASNAVVVMHFKSGGSKIMTRQPNGRYEAKHQSNRSYRIFATVRSDDLLFTGHGDGTGRSSRPIHVQETLKKASKLPTNKGNRIVATVKNQQGDRIPGVAVQVRDGDKNVVETLVTNTEGQVAFWNLGSELYQVRAREGSGWVTPPNHDGYILFEDTRDGWTPIFRITPTDHKTLLVMGERTQHVGSDADGVADGTDFGDMDTLSNVRAVSNRSANVINRFQTFSDSRLVARLTAGTAAGGPLATDVVVPLFHDWSKTVPQFTGVQKRNQCLVLRDGRPIWENTLHHGPNSLLARELQATQQYVTFEREIIRAIKTAINRRVRTGTLDMDMIDIGNELGNRPTFSPNKTPLGIQRWFLAPEPLKRIIGGFQGSAVRIRNFKVHRSGRVYSGLKVKYSAELQVILADDFGVDSSDMENADLAEIGELAGLDAVKDGAAGLRAQWTLQHERGTGNSRHTAAAYVNQILVRSELEGKFRVPFGYGRLLDSLQ